MNKSFFISHNTELMRKFGRLIERVDTTQMRKLASADKGSRDFLLDHKPDEDHFLVHLIALGDGETYGCFFAGAPVQTVYGQRKIETVGEGCPVLTTDGSYHPVTKVFQQEYHGERHTLTFRGSDSEFVCTANQPLFVVPQDFYDNFAPSTESLAMAVGEWKPAKDVRRGTTLYAPYPWKGEGDGTHTTTLLGGQTPRRAGRAWAQQFFLHEAPKRKVGPTEGVLGNERLWDNTCSVPRSIWRLKRQHRKQFLLSFFKTLQERVTFHDLDFLWDLQQAMLSVGMEIVLLKDQGAHHLVRGGNGPRPGLLGSFVYVQSNKSVLVKTTKYNLEVEGPHTYVVRVLVHNSNRNADYFPKAANQEYHPTFVKHAKFFREHRNTDPNNNMGEVKAAWYNPEMKRVELAVWGHKKKASDVFDRLKESAETSFSMSCYVPYDRDNCTGKLAKSPAEYEDHMRFNPNGWVPKFQKYAYVLNDKPRFFDISYVSKPADRIAHYLRYDLGLKAASEEKPVIYTGAGLAADMGFLDPHPDFGNMLQKAADAEEWFEQGIQENRPEIVNGWIWTSDPRAQVEPEHMRSLSGMGIQKVATGLCKHAATLPLQSFIELMTGKGPDETGPLVVRLQKKTTRIFRDLKDNPSTWSHASKMLPDSEDPIERVFSQVAHSFGDDTPDNKRTLTIRATLSEAERLQKQGSTEDLNEEEHSLLCAYGLYKIAYLCGLNERGGLTNDRLYRTISQNFFSRP